MTQRVACGQISIRNRETNDEISLQEYMDTFREIYADGDENRIREFQNSYEYCYEVNFYELEKGLH